MMQVLRHKKYRFAQWSKSSFLAGCTSLLIACALASFVVASDRVTIEIAGEIEAECRVEGLNRHLDLGNFSAAGSASILFEVYCNTPFRYSVQSRDGGLKHVNAPPDDPAFTANVPYVVNIRINTNEGVIDDQCQSTALVGPAANCPFTHSGTAVSINQQAELDIFWTSDKKLIAGAYEDMLTFTIGQQL